MNAWSIATRAPAVAPRACGTLVAGSVRLAAEVTDQCVRLTGVALPQPMDVLLERDRQSEREACAGPGEAGPTRAGQ
jgi:hypothetical protein